MANSNTTLIAFDDVYIPTTRDEVACIQYMENPKFRIENNKGAWTLVGENVYKFSWQMKSKQNALDTLQVMWKASHMHKNNGCDSDMVVKFGEMAARGIPVCL